ncbi:MAG: hypothetical protein ACE14P_07110 [Methanotrichaceae archaeon]
MMIFLIANIVNAAPLSVNPGSSAQVKPGVKPQLLAPYINIALIKIAPASPGNSKPVNISVSVVSPATQKDICGLGASNFKIDTQMVPPYGAAVIIKDVFPISSIAVGQSPNCDYWISLVPTSYNGKQYTWITGTYTLKLYYIQNGQQLANKTFSFRV